MKHILTLPAATLSVLPVFALAEPLKIVTDIAPIESLVIQVAGPDAEVTALVAAGASAHGFQLSYDQANAVQSADVAIYVGPQLSPWFEGALETIAPETFALALLNTEDWPSLTLRERATFFIDDDHVENEERDDDDDDHAGLEQGQVGDLDPHAWIDPQVAIAWVDDIAATLTEADPENSAIYSANAEATIADLTALDAEIAEKLAGLEQTPFVAPHDAYQYFGNRYDVPAIGSISLSDAATPGPDHIEALQELIRENNIACVLSDPQSRIEWVDLVREGTDANTAVVDALGTAYPRGADQYAATIRGLADAYATCLGGTE